MNAHKNPTYEHLWILSQQILEIDEIITDTLMSTGTSSTTKSTTLLNLRRFAFTGSQTQNLRYFYLIDYMSSVPSCILPPSWVVGHSGVSRTDYGCVEKTLLLLIIMHWNSIWVIKYVRIKVACYFPCTSLTCIFSTWLHAYFFIEKD